MRSFKDGFEMAKISDIALVGAVVAGIYLIYRSARDLGKILGGDPSDSKDLNQVIAEKGANTALSFLKDIPLTPFSLLDSMLNQGKNIFDSVLGSSEVRPDIPRITGASNMSSKIGTLTPVDPGAPGSYEAWLSEQQNTSMSDFLSQRIVESANAYFGKGQWTSGSVMPQELLLEASYKPSTESLNEALNSGAQIIEKPVDQSGLFQDVLTGSSPSGRAGEFYNPARMAYYVSMIPNDDMWRTASGTYSLFQCNTCTKW